MESGVRRKTSDLRKRRVSWPGARYFVTCCVVRPSQILTTPACAAGLIETIRCLDADGDVALHCATIMPDHVHLLFTLGNRLTVSRAVAKMKGLTERSLRGAGGRWQENFFAHRLQVGEELDPFARYVFMNPYRAGLAPILEEWPFWVRGRTVPAFMSMLMDGRFPPIEWMAQSPEEMGLAASGVGSH